jgi:hypothetical protein
LPPRTARAPVHKAHARRARSVEQRLDLGIGHGSFEESVDLGVVRHPPARKECGQRKFGKDHEVRAARDGFIQQFQQTLDDLCPRIGQVDGAQLGDGQGEEGAFA